MLLAVVAAFLIDFRPHLRFAPQVKVGLRVAGPLFAGAGRAALEPTLPATVAGYGPGAPSADRARTDLFARALVLETGGQRLALVSLDLLEVPRELVAAVEARLQDLSLNGLLIAATHTHTSFGGYDPRLLAQMVALGRFRPDALDAVAFSVERAVREARGELAPAQMAVGRGQRAGLQRSRSRDLAEPGDLLGMRFDRLDGSPVAKVIFFAAHPTLAAREPPELDADYPGELARLLDQSGGIGLFFQTAVGDASVAEGREQGPRAFAERMLETARPALAADPLPREVELGFASAKWALPAVELGAAPWLLRRLAANAFTLVAPKTTAVVAARIGPVLLAAVPGEPTGEVSASAQKLLEPLSGPEGVVQVLSLTNDYVGYVETPERVRAGTGESARSYFGPELAARMLEALRAAAEPLRSPMRESPPSAVAVPR